MMLIWCHATGNFSRKTTPHTSRCHLPNCPIAFWMGSDACAGLLASVTLLKLLSPLALLLASMSTATNKTKNARRQWISKYSNATDFDNNANAFVLFFFYMERKPTPAFDSPKKSYISCSFSHRKVIGCRFLRLYSSIVFCHWSRLSFCLILESLTCTKFDLGYTMV